MAGSIHENQIESQRAWLFLGTLVAAYIGVYLCRKNLAVAVPLLQADWGLRKEQVGIIGSLSTVVYAAGKLGFGPVTDGLGGRRALLGSMLLVALFGAGGAFAPSLGALTLLYSANRLAGAASWGAMVKLVPDWFPPHRLGFACGVLSLSFMVGGALAVAFAGLVAGLSNDSWRAVLGVPSLVLAACLAAVWFVIPRGEPRPAATGPTPPAQPDGNVRLAGLFRERTFLVVLALSFGLTLLRETFNFWTVDFIRTQGGDRVSSSLAAWLSTPFDLGGGVGILLVGWVFGRLGRAARPVFLAGILTLLALVLGVFPFCFGLGLGVLTAGVGLIGLLTCGPYSLLAGVLAVEVRGKDQAATVSGFVDGVGYLAGVLSGVCFGQLVTLGGYRLGFQVMAVLTAATAILSLFLYPRRVRLGTSAPANLQPSLELK